MEKIGEDHIHHTIDEAVASFASGSDGARDRLL
jgi:hypothetical protein